MSRLIGADNFSSDLKYICGLSRIGDQMRINFKGSGYDVIEHVSKAQFAEYKKAFDEYVEDKKQGRVQSVIEFN